jgi:5-methylcytosine-specific restriction endonuclease McrA
MARNRIANIDACRRYRQKNPQKARDRTRESMQRYRRERSEEDLARYRLRYARNPEPFLESVQKRLEHGRNRARRERERTPPWLNPGELAAVYERCPEGMHVDHIVPLDGVTVEGYPVTGLHLPWNLQYLPARVNLTKHTKMRTVDHATIGENSRPQQLSLWDD